MSAMNVAATLDEVPKPAWIALMVLAFIVFWPLGLAILAYLIWSRRMGCWTHGRSWQHGQRYAEAAQRWCGPSRGGASSGNRACDEYRQETLRRLEDEQRDFVAFLERLRFAKDRAEFDQFMAERRQRPPEGPQPQPQG